MEVWDSALNSNNLGAQEGHDDFNEQFHPWGVSQDIWDMVNSELPNDHGSSLPCGRVLLSESRICFLNTSSPYECVVGSFTWGFLGGPYWVVMGKQRTILTKKEKKKKNIACEAIM